VCSSVAPSSIPIRWSNNRANHRAARSVGICPVPRLARTAEFNVRTPSPGGVKIFWPCGRAPLRLGVEFPAGFSRFPTRARRLTSVLPRPPAEIRVLLAFREVLRWRTAFLRRTLPFSGGKRRSYVELSRFLAENGVLTSNFLVFWRKTAFLRRTFSFSGGKRRSYVELSRFPTENGVLTSNFPVFRRRTAFLRRTFSFSGGERKSSVDLFRWLGELRRWPAWKRNFPAQIAGFGRRMRPGHGFCPPFPGSWRRAALNSQPLPQPSKCHRLVARPPLLWSRGNGPRAAGWRRATQGNRATLRAVGCDPSHFAVDTFLIVASIVPS